jgi:hypothetical protein
VQKTACAADHLEAKRLPGHLPEAVRLFIVSAGTEASSIIVCEVPNI